MLGLHFARVQARDHVAVTAGQGDLLEAQHRLFRTELAVAVLHDPGPVPSRTRQ